MDVTYILILLLLGAAATYFSGDKWAPKTALLFSLAAFAETLAVLKDHSNGADVSFSAGWITNPQINMAFLGDGLSLIMVLLTTALTPLIVFSGFGNNFKNARAMYGLIMFMAFAMCGTFLAADGLLYYIFWELALIPIYFIALIWGNGDAEARKKAVVKFFIYTFAGSLFMLAAFAYLYQRTGSFMVGDLSEVNLTMREQYWTFLAFFAAYAIKIPLIPFHSWQASVYQKSPTVGTMLLSGIMLKMGLYSILRWQLPIAPLAAKAWLPILLGVSIAGVIYGSIVALREKDLKRLLAYSSLAHVGLIAGGCYTLTTDGLTGAVLQMLAHGFVVVGLFFVAEVIYRRYQTNAISEMGGIRIQTPKFSSMFLIFVLASVGLPGTFNFVGEFMVLFGLAQVNIGFAVVGGLTIILSSVYMFRMFQRVMLGEKNSRPFADVTTNEGIALAIIAGVLIVFAFYTTPLTDLVAPSIENILTYINRYGS